MENSRYYLKGNFIIRGKIKHTLLKNTITRNIVYFFQSVLVKNLILINRLNNKKRDNYKYTVSICGIFKNESKFLHEWIAYHLVIGVDHFYLYNNNSDDDYLKILEPYIKQGIVDLIEWPYEQGQMAAYEDCYKTRQDETNWLTFIDIDEFICLTKCVSLKEFLKLFINYPNVAVYWRQFGSNGKLVHDDSQLVLEQYSQCWGKFSTYTKMFCNMNFPIVDFDNMHILYSKIFGISIPPVNQFKKIISFGINRGGSVNKSMIQINHYWGKAYDCFKSKISRSDAYYGDVVKMGLVRQNLLLSHEEMCSVRDYNIQRYLLETKLKMKNIK